MSKENGVRGVGEILKKAIKILTKTGDLIILTNGLRLPVRLPDLTFGEKVEKIVEILRRILEAGGFSFVSFGEQKIPEEIREALVKEYQSPSLGENNGGQYVVPRNWGIYPGKLPEGVRGYFQEVDRERLIYDPNTKEFFLVAYGDNPNERRLIRVSDFFEEGPLNFLLLRLSQDGTVWTNTYYPCGVASPINIHSSELPII